MEHQLSDLIDISYNNQRQAQRHPLFCCKNEARAHTCGLLHSWHQDGGGIGQAAGRGQAQRPARAPFATLQLDDRGPRAGSDGGFADFCAAPGKIGAEPAAGALEGSGETRHRAGPGRARRVWQVHLLQHDLLGQPAAAMPVPGHLQKVLCPIVRLLLKVFPIAEPTMQVRC
jgi:hypothetical protein